MPEEQTSPTPQPLTNSQRRLYKATYRPLAVPTPPQEQGRGRVIEKLAFLRGLNIQPQEFARLESEAAARAPDDSLRVIEIIKALGTDLSFAAMRRDGPLLANTSPEELVKIGNALHEIRISLAADARNKLRELQDRFQGALRAGLVHNMPSVPQASAEAAVEWARAEGLP
jgi:hypothetical protein